MEESDQPQSSSKNSRTGQLVLIAFLAIAIAAVSDRIIAACIGWAAPGGFAYRRIGPTSGPQVFVAGSSVLQFGLSWREISDELGQGMESWGVGGSSPDIWEVSQRLSTNSNLMIIGFSIFDMNEFHLADSRAKVVPLTQTVLDLHQSEASWKFSQRVLSQYPLAIVRTLFPTAGESDAVLVGLRQLAREKLGLSASSEELDRALVLPSQPVLDFGGAATRLSDWPEGKVLRRLSLLRTENRGLHSFNGPKLMAFRRMMLRAKQQGNVIIVVVPVAGDYAHAFMTPEVISNFEQVVSEGQRIDPEALVVRLDRVPALNSDVYFSDFVHLNGAGRNIATRAFMEKLKTFRDKSLSKK